MTTIRHNALRVLVVVLLAVGCLFGCGPKQDAAFYRKQLPAYFTTKGLSNMPHIPPGVKVYVVDYPFPLIRNKVAVFYKAPYGLVAHPVVGQDDKGYITQGYGNTSPDPWYLTEDAYVGIVASIQK